MRKRQLQTRRHGAIALTEMGFGGGPLGNLFRAISEEQAQATLDAAHDAGMRYFDTAPYYGLGLSERRTGEAIARWGRESLVISTKIGRIIGAPGITDPAHFVIEDPPSYAYDYSYDGVMRSYEQSRARLGTEQIDILLIHDLDLAIHGDEATFESYFRQAMDSGFKALDELRAAGAVKAIGAGLNEWEACERFARAADFDCFLLAGRYTLLEQGALESCLPLCVERGMAIILGGPYNSGILATGPVAGAMYRYKPAPPEILDRVVALQQICEAHDVRLAEAALHFVLGHPAVVSVIPGAAAPQEVARNVAALNKEVPPELWSDLKAEGLVRDDAPVPG